MRKLLWLCGVLVLVLSSVAFRSQARQESTVRTPGAANKCDAPCPVFQLNPKADAPLATISVPTAGSCTAQTRNGMAVPDPKCTPGAVNPTLTLAVLKDPKFRTCCVRDGVESEEAKHIVYKWYGIPDPPGNIGEHQVCELDHLISLELGGADSLDNVWPQCGSDTAVLKDRYFKQKDFVEDYLAAQVRNGGITLDAAQHGIASDWTQYLAAAKTYCATNKCEGGS
jgi:hypothetical protein